MWRIALLLLLWMTGCFGPVKTLYPPRPGEAVRTVYVVNHNGRHTGIAVLRADIPRHLWPGSRDYPQARHVEIGWGDDDGYRRELTTGIVLKALAGSRRTVLLVDGFSSSLAENYDDPGYQIIEIQLSERGFERLCEHIDQTYALDGDGHPIALGDDWYRARGTYCLFNTCNTWVAKGLRSAGCPITPIYCITRGPLLYQARKIGRVVPVTKRE